MEFEVLALIPARSGSKGIKDKNIRPLAGKPLIAYSIEQALQSKLIHRVIVSTDSSEYAELAKQYGAEVPFLRPQEISGDFALDIEAFRHALQFLKDTEGYCPEIVVQLRPTYPFRAIEDIDNMVKMLLDHPEADSVRSVAPVAETPYKMWREEEGRLYPLLDEIEEAYNMPRQKLPVVYMQNACIDCVRSRVILEENSMSGKVIMGYKMNHNFDIDTEEDLKKVEEFYRRMKDGKF